MDVSGLYDYVSKRMQGDEPTESSAAIGIDQFYRQLTLIMMFYPVRLLL